MKKLALAQIALLSLPLVFALALDPYTNVVFVTNTLAWPYNSVTYGNDTFQEGGADNADTQLLLSAKQGLKFPESFGFGVACSAYQYEGNQKPTSTNPDGIGWSMWDVFSEKYSWLNPQGTNINEALPTSVYTKPSGAEAIQGYFPKYATQDLDLVKNLGVQYYRLSISWPRLFPHANLTAPDPEGVRYYTNILEELKRRHVKVLITLYHWDLPAWLYNFGEADVSEKDATFGWLDGREAKDNLTIKEFQKYASASYRAFGRYTPYFSTFNEPLTFTNSAFVDGVHAPGQYGWQLLQKYHPELYGSNKDEYLQQVPYLQAINLIKAHYISYKTIHALYDQNKKYYGEEPKVSIVLNSDWAEPYRIECDAAQKNCHYNADDIQASKNNMDFMLGWWLHPVIYGTWPDSMQSIYENRLKNVGLQKTRESSCLTKMGVPVRCDAHTKIALADYIAQGGALDMIALNHYTGYFAVDFTYAQSHVSPVSADNAVPPDQYNNNPNTLRKGWALDQNAFITQFRYRKLGALGDKPLATDRVYVVGSAGNRPWLRQTWFVYHELLEYINYYYLQQKNQDGLPTHTKMGVPFASLSFYLTENGTSIYKESQNGTLHDANRIQYLLGNLAAVKQAVDEGISVSLYTYWSIADNFEWSEGYDSRFGLIWIDYANDFKRMPKDSYFCYKGIITNDQKLKMAFCRVG